MARRGVKRVPIAARTVQYTTVQHLQVVAPETQVVGRAQLDRLVVVLDLDLAEQLQVDDAVGGVRHLVVEVVQEQVRHGAHVAAVELALLVALHQVAGLDAVIRRCDGVFGGRPLHLQRGFVPYRYTFRCCTNQASTTRYNIINTAFQQFTRQIQHR